MKETTFTVWVVDCDFHRFPTLRVYTATRVSESSVTVSDGGRTEVIKAAGSRRWFTEREQAKAHIRAACVRLEANLAAELKKVRDALDKDEYPGRLYRPEPPPPVVTPEGWLDD